MTDDNLYDYMDGLDLMTYRLVDGSYIMAEEVDVDEENNVFFIGDPLELIRNSFGFRITPWGFPTDTPELIQLCGDQIITRSEACPELRKYYGQFVSKRADINNMTEEELREKIDKTFAELDKLDQEEAYNEESEQSEFQEELQPKVIKKSSLNHPRWDWSDFGE